MAFNFFVPDSSTFLPPSHPEDCRETGNGNCSRFITPHCFCSFLLTCFLCSSMCPFYGLQSLRKRLLLKRFIVDSPMCHWPCQKICSCMVLSPCAAVPAGIQPQPEHFMGCSFLQAYPAYSAEQGTPWDAGETTCFTMVFSVGCRGISALVLWCFLSFLPHRPWCLQGCFLHIFITPHSHSCCAAF